MEFGGEKSLSYKSNRVNNAPTQQNPAIQAEHRLCSKCGIHTSCMTQIQEGKTNSI